MGKRYVPRRTPRTCRPLSLLAPPAPLAFRLQAAARDPGLPTETPPPPYLCQRHQ